MIKRISAGFGAAALLALFTPSAQAACGFTLSGASLNTVSVSWNLSFSTKTISFVLTKANNPECYYWIGITKGGAATAAERRAATAGGRQLRYQLYKNNGLSQVLQDNSDGAITSVDNVINGYFGPGINQAQTITYYLEIPNALATSPSLVKDGLYSDGYTIRVYEGSDPTVLNPAPEITAAVTFQATVPNIINLSLVDSGGAFDIAKTTKTISFGSLSRMVSRGFDLIVRSNAGYEITLTSANNGSLKSAVSNATIPYTFYANESPLVWVGGSANSGIVPGTGQTGLNGVAYPMRIEIGPVDKLKVGGDYADSLVITATTTE